MPHPYTVVIIAAAGSGTRMKKTPDKIVAKVKGKYVIDYTIENFERSSFVDEIVLVVSKKNTDKIYRSIKENGFKKVTSIVEGSTSRVLSVSEGLKAVNPKCKYIAVHDGARPLLRPSNIDLLLQKAYKEGNLVCGKKVVDTTKKVNKDGIIEKTIDRSKLFQVQTPQILRFDQYKSAVKEAIKDPEKFTDDSSILEKAGYKVKAIEIDGNNMKITTDEDLEYFKYLVRKGLMQDEKI